MQDMCSLMIASGSYMYPVSEDDVQQLRLKVELNTELYDKA